MDNTINQFAKYTGKTADDLRTEAEQDIQDDIVEELIAEIESAKLIQPIDKTFEVELDYDNLREWLRLYYRLERK